MNQDTILEKEFESHEYRSSHESGSRNLESRNVFIGASQKGFSWLAGKNEVAAS